MSLGIKARQWALRQVNGHKSAAMGMKTRQYVYCKGVSLGIKAREWAQRRVSKWGVTGNKSASVGIKTCHWA